MPQELSLRVVGVAYANKDGGNRRTEIMFCNPGEFIELRLEPKNEADPHAVAVFSARGFQIGYLSAERAPWIGGFMRQGRDIRAIFQEPTEYGAVIRVAFDGIIPTLPSPRPERDENFFDELYQPDADDDGADWCPPDA